MTQYVHRRMPNTSVSAEHQLEKYFGETSGYVRRLNTGDAKRSLYIKDGYGFFNPYGQLMGSSVEREDVVERVHKEGFILFPLQ